MDCVSLTGTNSSSGASGHLYNHLQNILPASQTVLVFANAYFILTSRWTSQHFSISEIGFSPAPSCGPLVVIAADVHKKLSGQH